MARDGDQPSATGLGLISMNNKHQPASVNTHAVIVTYKPDLAALEAQLARLRPQVSAIAIIDNASEETARIALRDLAKRFDAMLLENENNLGIATALNQGIACAREKGASHVLLMDQDSLPANDMVEKLHAALARLSMHEKVAAVGPVAEDLRDGVLAPFVRVGFPLNRKIAVARGETVRCDFLITSGSLVPMAVIDSVGGMDEGLFIDNVDLEWSFRSARAGHALYGIGDARMGHRIGDGVRRLPLGASFVHSPVRLYYMMRNRILLYRRIATPWLWIAQDIPRALLKLLRFSLLVRPRRANALAMLAGVKDGLLGRTGAKSDNAG